LLFLRLVALTTDFIKVDLPMPLAPHTKTLLAKFPSANALVLRLTCLISLSHSF